MTHSRPSDRPGAAGGGRGSRSAWRSRSASEWPPSRSGRHRQHPAPAHAHDASWAERRAERRHHPPLHPGGMLRNARTKCIGSSRRSAPRKASNASGSSTRRGGSASPPAPGRRGAPSTSVQSSATAAMPPAAPLVRLDRPDRIRIFNADDGTRVLGIIAPIHNEPDCMRSCHAHAPTRRCSASSTSRCGSTSSTTCWQLRNASSGSAWWRPFLPSWSWPALSCGGWCCVPVRAAHRGSAEGPWWRPLGAGRRCERGRDG